MKHPLQAILDEAVEKRVFPAASSSVWLNGKPLFEGHSGAASASSVFDLASLTKVIATTSLFMCLWQKELVEPKTTLQSLMPSAQAVHPGTTLGDLLLHRSGLPAFVPYFAPIVSRYPELLSADCSASLRRLARRDTLAEVMATVPVEPLGRRAVYSDVGFILLGEGLANRVNRPLDVAFDELIAQPLSLKIRYRRISERPSVDTTVVPTQHIRPRPPAPGQEGLWKIDAQAPSSAGEVDDDNAWVMDGVAGHAGLFGAANEVARFGQAILDDMNGAGRIAHRDRWEKALQVDAITSASTRAFGFDTPSSEGSSAGRYLSQSKGVFGHLGFTGTSLWVDPARQLVIALCSNRTALGRDNLGIRELRPRYHDAVVEFVRNA